MKGRVGGTTYREENLQQPASGHQVTFAFALLMFSHF